MKIVYLNPSAQLGGAERVLVDVLASLRDAQPEWSMHLVVPSEGPLVEKVRHLGVEVTVLSLPAAVERVGDFGVGKRAGNQVGWFKLASGVLLAAGGLAGYLRQLRQLLAGLAPDVVHSNGAKMHIIGLWARPVGVPVVWHIHDYVSPRPVMTLLLRKHASRCAAAIANSASVAADLKAVCGNRVRTYVVHNAIDIDRFRANLPSLDLDALAGLQPPVTGTLRVGLVATLGRWKGHEVFLRALATLPGHLAVRGYIVGGAIYANQEGQTSIAELRDLADRLGLGSRVGFTGFVENSAAAIRALDIVVHASTQPEPFGLVIVEAMAAGRAVIASQAGGATEIVEEGHNGLMHPPGNAAILAERIQQLATSSELRQRLGRNGRATVERRFDRSRLAAELRPIYDNAVLEAS
jgi:glycosyltransferase involved in cell wall biosynthesis